ncbi:hypothetical protein A6R68_00696 [Neotoma lepida]|uniref:PH domain-containing protein n=1 Tax=Neotoma lepida TaxID=56216 RepID=A0A1A6GWQ0_NEOLE|nr:hypothetical protein A6R68_00696 [Neotoma lepida]
MLARNGGSTLQATLPKQQTRSNLSISRYQTLEIESCACAELVMKQQPALQNVCLGKRTETVLLLKPMPPNPHALYAVMQSPSPSKLFAGCNDQLSLHSSQAPRFVAASARLHIKVALPKMTPPLPPWALGGSDEEYIYMNKVSVNSEQNSASPHEVPKEQGPLTNGEASQHSSAPQKSLPDLPPLKMDGEAVSSSYESYDEEENSKGKAAPYQWPSPEASIELMRDARICAFLWRKKWLGQWAKQLCVIRDTRLLCYKSSKDHSPQLDVNLLGSSVVHKEKQVRKKEHKLKITPMHADVIVLGLQSKDQAEQWLRVEPSYAAPANGSRAACAVL